MKKYPLKPLGLCFFQVHTPTIRIKHEYSKMINSCGVTIFFFMIELYLTEISTMNELGVLKTKKTNLYNKDIYK